MDVLLRFSLEGGGVVIALPCVLNKQDKTDRNGYKGEKDRVTGQ